MTHQTLVQQIIDEVEVLPENLTREVLDFVGYLRTKHVQNTTEQDELLATFGTWEDEREAEEIIEDITLIAPSPNLG